MHFKLRFLDLHFWQDHKGFDNSEIREVLSIDHNKCKI